MVSKLKTTVAHVLDASRDPQNLVLLSRERELSSERRDQSNAFIPICLDLFANSWHPVEKRVILNI